MLRLSIKESLHHRNGCKVRLFIMHPLRVPENIYTTPSWHSERKAKLYFLCDLAFNFICVRPRTFFQQFLRDLRAKGICLTDVEFNRKYMKLTKFVCDLSAWGVCIRNSLICYTIQQKIYETHKIWHPSEQNYFFVHFNKRYQYFQEVCENFGNSGGEWEGGKFWGPILENPEGKLRGVIQKIPSVGVVWIFSGTTHWYQRIFSRCLSTHFSSFTFALFHCPQWERKPLAPSRVINL